MTPVTWTFEGVLLPGGEDDRVVITGAGRGQSMQALPGRYALTGLVDAHAHLTVRDDHTLGTRDLARRRLHEYAGIGVSTVRDVGGRSEVTLPLAREPEEGLPIVVTAGRFLAPEGRYFPDMYQPVAPGDLRTAASAELKHGATWLKLIADFPLMTDDGPVPGSLSPTYEIESVGGLVEFAHQQGARVAVHTQSRHAAALVAAGVDSVEHGEWLDEEAVHALGARGGAWTPTLAAITNPPHDASDKRRRYAAEASERLRVLLPLAVRSGVRILAGTDAVAALPQEVALLVRHGVEPHEALAAASNAAEEWLRPGTATTDSIVTYDADPRDDPAVLNSPVSFVLRGRRVR